MRDRRQHFSFSCLSYSLLLCALFTFPHTPWYAHPVSLGCFIQGQLNISCLQFFPCPRRKILLCFYLLIQWRRLRLTYGLTYSGMDARCHIGVPLLQFAFYVGILFVNKSDLGSRLYCCLCVLNERDVTASHWISSHTHVLLHNTHYKFTYVTHALLKDSWLSHVFHTWIFRRIYGIRLATVRILTNENPRPWN